MGNPFAIKLPELEKKQGTQGVEQVKGTQNTAETRAAKEKDALKGTNVLNATNGGSMATTYGTFENYDGFTRNISKEQKEEQEGRSLLESVTGATSDAKKQKSNCQDYSKTAEDDKNSTNKQVKKQQSATKSMQNTVSNAVDQRDKLDSESEALRSEVDSLNAEIESLMAEDGQTYTPQTVAEAPVAPAVPQQNDTGVNEQAAGIQSEGVNSDASISATNNENGANAFAMNSLPSNNQESFVPTSTTAVAAQNSQQQSAVQQNSNKQQNQAAQGSAQKSASSATGSSLHAFGANLVQPKGKNADKINELLSQVSAKNATITSNQSQSVSLTQKASNSASSFQQQLKKIMSQTVKKQAVNKDNHQGAEVAQFIGTGTQLTGSVATATGSAMLAFSFGSNQLGTALVAGGGAATAAGSATSGIAQATQGDLQGAATSMTNGMNSFTSSMQTYKAESHKLNKKS